eukprot:TRINITY_DN4919_c0_g1_i2.p1 TRINITY_DN4919_c0_g1~~TRINITY_DN4919_c0_g1_i2.p1  ORF type:complete len:356 (-),score=96.60 TRINITY_DN4919_c0_g1_i2:4-1071(-)
MNDFAKREEELRRLNAELEAKRRSTMENADTAVRNHHEKLSNLRVLVDQETDDNEDDLTSDVHPRTQWLSAGTPSSPLRAPEWGLTASPGVSRPAANTTAGSSRQRPSFTLDSLGSPAVGLGSVDRPPSAPRSEPLPVPAPSATPVVEEAIGEEAAGRYAAAKLRVVQEELELALKEVQTKETQVRRLGDQLKATHDELAKVQKREKAQHSATERAQRQGNDSQEKRDLLEKKVASLSKEVDTLTQKQKSFDKESQQKDLRLNRALEEVERLKGQIKDSQSNARNTGDSLRKGHDQLVADNKKLEKQKAELIVAFKKQLKLIDVLRRQKMHVEAARLLSFTEEEFTKTLEMGERV